MPSESENEAIRKTLCAWVEAYHLPGGYGDQAKLPEAGNLDPWEYLCSCLCTWSCRALQRRHPSIYFEFLDHPIFAHCWMRWIRDFAEAPDLEELPSASMLAEADVPESSDAARRAVAGGTVVAMRQDESGAPEYLVLALSEAEGAVYVCNAARHRKHADSLAAFIAHEVAQVRGQMPKTYRFDTGGEGESVGWMYGWPPGLREEEWPRHRRDGFPLIHGFTLELPEAYRVRKTGCGAHFVALSHFHSGRAESDDADAVRAIFEATQDRDEFPDDPFLVAVATHARALRAGSTADREIHVFEDSLGDTHAMVFHTEASFGAPRARFPAEVGGLKLEDLYSGLDYPDPDTPGAEPPDEPLFHVENGRIQLGRPLHPVQPSKLVSRMGLYVLEIETDVGGVNYGDGNAQYDLESGLFDWACV